MATIFIDSYSAKDDDVVEAEMELLNVAIKHSAAYAFAPANQPVALPAGDDDFVIRSFRVSFNDQGVRRDIGAQLNYTDGGAAHWADNDGDGEVAGAGQPLGWLAEASAEHSYPVSYARSSDAGENRITAGAVFVVEGNPRPGVQIRWEGTGPGGGEFIGDAMIVPLPQNPAIKLVAINDASSQPLPATIDKGRLTIHWRLIKPKQNADPEIIEYGDSINPIYVTGAGAAGAFHTVVDVACDSASGLSPGDNAGTRNIIDRIWLAFADRHVQTARGELIPYWLDTQNHPPANQITLGEMLGASPPRGQCTAWVEFLQSALAVHGVASISLRVAPIDGERFPEMKFKDMPAQGTGGANFPNEQNPFVFHQLVRIASVPLGTWGNLYDPSFGNLVEHASFNEACAIYEASYLKSLVRANGTEVLNTPVQELIFYTDD